MTITFLGTAAATSYPVVFCRCPNCEKARALGGPSLRKRSSALINSDLLLDFGPDIMASSFAHNCSISNVRYCLQTHPHSDHLDLSHLYTRAPDYVVVDVPSLKFFASEATIQKAASLFENECSDGNLLDPTFCEQLNLEIHAVETLQAFEVGGYHIVAFSANHDHSASCLLYAVESDGKTIFYGTDTAILPEETWQGFHRFNLQFDVVVLDHTYGPDLPGTDHLNAQQFIEHIGRMREEQLLTDNARAFATHISHEGNPVHPELAEFAANNGYEIAYDGLTV